MICRGIDESDLLECLAVAGDRAGFELVGRTQGIAAWSTLLRNASFNCAVIESTVSLARHQIIGFGSSVLVSPVFADVEISNPRPGLNSRIIQSVSIGKSVVLTDFELRRGNTRSSLDLVVLCNCLREEVLTAGQVSQVQALLSSSFLECYIGYRFRMLISETVGDADREFARSSLGWRTVCDFESLEPGCRNYFGAAKRSLVVITRAEGLAVPGSITGLIFHCPDPVLRLRSADQQLLIAASSGLTDKELSSELGLSLPAVKKRWISLFERIEDQRPDLFPTLARDPGSEKRGRQKRHHVLAYIRRHPEEIRPREPDNFR